MKEPKIGDFVMTNETAGIVTSVGLYDLELNNNVNIVTVNFDEITEVV